MLGRLAVAHAVVLGLAGLVLAMSPATVSSPIAPAEALVLVGGLTAMLVVSLALTQRVLLPLERLRSTMRRIDPLRPGRRVAVTGGGREVRELGESFNAMLDRVETERRESAREALAAQERERMRIARELHVEATEAELVVFRVAQEALTNVSRHAGATRMRISFGRGPTGALRLLVRDDGRGLDGAAEGSGIRGMRERAMLIGARLAIEDRGDGVAVTLDVSDEQVRS